jgi:hypothetical protein
MSRTGTKQVERCYSGRMIDAASAADTSQALTDRVSGRSVTITAVQFGLLLCAVGPHGFSFG